MSEKSFQHLFPSPGLEQIFKIKKKQETQKMENLSREHINNQIYGFSQAKIQEEAANYRKMIQRNRQRFLASVRSLEKTKKSLQNKRIPKSLGLKFKSKKKIRQTKKDLYQKIQLHKTSIEETPMIFIQGKINLIEIDNFLAQLQITKVLNYTSRTVDQISCRVIAVPKKLDKNEINLKKEDYQIVLASYLPPIKPRSTAQYIQLSGKFLPQPKSTRLYLLMIDEIDQKILYVAKCSNLHKITEKALQYQKIDQMIF